MPLRILLADDNRGLVESIGALLRREGFDVVGEAADGREAVDLAREHRPDVAVIDFRMPRLDGLEAAREMRRISSSTRTILLTFDDDQVLAALGEGIRGYVVKSRIPEDLAAAVREVARGRFYLSPGTSHAVAQAYLASLAGRAR